MSKDSLPRRTLSIALNIDSLYGYDGWWNFQKHNGFRLSFGILSFNVWIVYVRQNYT